MEASTGPRSRLAGSSSSSRSFVSLFYGMRIPVEAPAEDQQGRYGTRKHGALIAHSIHDARRPRRRAHPKRPQHASTTRRTVPSMRRHLPPPRRAPRSVGGGDGRLALRAALRRRVRGDGLVVTPFTGRLAALCGRSAHTTLGRRCRGPVIALLIVAAVLGDARISVGLRIGPAFARRPPS